MTWRPDRDALRDRVAVVAGATRGAGRGIATALGEAGATVICTGRSSVTGSGRSDYDRPETIEETAELVTRMGGTGIACQVDHLESDQVRALAGRIRAEHGRIDVLVNDIWGAEVLKGGPASWNTPIWEHGLDAGLRILRLAVETHLVTSHHLLPLLVGRPGGLLVEVTDGTSDYNASRYRISVFYDLAKVAVNRLAFSQGHELAPHGATAVAITPGWLRSEMMLDNFGVTEGNWRDALEEARSTATPARHRGSRPRSRRATSAAPSPRWPPTPAGRGGTSGPSPPRNSPVSTGSPTSTARGRTAGPTSDLSRPHQALLVLRVGVGLLGGDQPGADPPAGGAYTRGTLPGALRGPPGRPMNTGRVGDRLSTELLIDGHVVVVQIRKSRRARTMRLTVGPGRPPEVVVPNRVRQRAVDEFITAKQRWLGDKLAELRAAADRPRELFLDRPGTIWLAGAPVQVSHDPAGRAVAALRAGRLAVGGTAEAASAAIERWYRREARRVLLEVAELEASRLGVRFDAVGVRDPRTRWGSCSHNGRLSFSWRLLMAPEYVLDYVVVHELCHLREFNHSRSFWQLVETARPEWREARDWLRRHGHELHEYRPASAVEPGAAR